MLLGRYEILELLGRGASSSVSKARDTMIGRIVALKTLQPGLSDLKWLEQFLSEAQIVGQLSHPSIVSLYDVGIDEASGTPYLVMEYVVGQTLERLLAGGETQSHHTYAWGADLAHALAYAHRHGVIHGDVKPANILVTEDGCVKLADFGIAQRAAHISQSGILRGTPAFLSPEEIEGRIPDGRSDLFSLGVVLYRVATGRRPFPGDSAETVCAQILNAAVTPPTEIDPALPPALNVILARCLAKNPAKRYADGEEVAAALEAVARQNAPLAPSKTRVKPLAPVFRRYRWATSLALVAICATLALGFFRNEFQPAPTPAAVLPAPKRVADQDLHAGGAQNWEATSPLESMVTSDHTERVVQPKSTAPSKIPKRSRPPGPIPAAPLTQAMPPPKSAPPPAKAAQSSPSTAAAELAIEISAKPSQETLAVFADHELLFRTSLTGLPVDEGEPFRRSYKLSSGQHQVTVALYKADETLRTEKEGRAELRAGAENLLTIQVTKPPKFLLLRRPGLKISWPGESATSDPK